MVKERCLCCCCSIFTGIGIIALGTMLTMNSINSPKLSLLNLQLPVVNSTLSFKLKLDNPNRDIEIYYSNLTISFHYPANQSSTFADVIVPAFYQRYRKKTVKTGTGETRNANWTDAVGAAVAIRVHVYRTLTFKRVRVWLLSKSRLSVEGVAGMDRQGTYASEKGLLLKSAATTKLPGIGCCPLLLLILL